jgi:Tol biopolymer transport system component
MRTSLIPAAAAALGLAACARAGSTAGAATSAPAAAPAAAPTTGAELFGVGVFSTGQYELPPTFAPDGRTAYFTVSTPAYGRLHMIVETRLDGGRWSEPRIAPFSGRYGDADPMFSPDGSRLYFISRRPTTPGGTPRGDFDVWVVERRGDGWGEPRHIPEASSPGAEHYVSAAADGTLYIAAVRPDSRGQGDVYRIPFENGRYGPPENLGPAVNSPDHHDTTPVVAPDQSYLIYSSWGRPGGSGSGGDLYVSFRRPDGTWAPARSLGPLVNSPRTEYCPILSPDGRWLYFASERGFADRPLPSPLATAEWTRLLASPGNGLGDTYRVPLGAVLDAAREAGGR